MHNDDSENNNIIKDKDEDENQTERLIQLKEDINDNTTLLTKFSNLKKQLLGITKEDYQNDISKVISNIRTIIKSEKEVLVSSDVIVLPINSIVNEFYLLFECYDANYSLIMDVFFNVNRDIKNIISNYLYNQEFQKEVYSILFSKVMNDYYKEFIKNVEIPQHNEYINKENIQQLHEKMYSNYIKMKEQLNSQKNLSDFFSMVFYPFELPNCIKGITHRFLRVLININGITVVKGKEKQNLINTNIKCLLMLTIIHEMNHFLRRLSCESESINNCSTPGNKDNHDGGELMFKELLNRFSFATLNETQSLNILNPINWNESKEKLQHSIKINTNDENKCVIHAMTILNDDDEVCWHCIPEQMDKKLNNLNQFNQ